MKKELSYFRQYIIVLLTVQASSEDNSFLVNGLSPISTRNLSFSCLIKMSPRCYQRMRRSVDKKWECGYRNVQQNIAFTFRDLIQHFMMFGLVFITPNIFLLNKSFSFAALRWKKYSSQGVYKLPLKWDISLKTGAGQRNSPNFHAFYCERRLRQTACQQSDLRALRCSTLQR